ncbi:MAG: phosphoenolpyruvate--protein phosphotransferase [Gammaproteobacteria bacterium]|nr:phosphoenolpyruvate--protein phosphotransferase [Gammaproteobacteria bacterium]MDD9870623.1 phosphoenolpyruvate--protein phosphotransferase [Gammaproteobacteria bacterium]
MLTLFGVGVGSGIAIGRAVLSGLGGGEVAEFTIKAGAVEEEVRRFNDAVARARGSLARLQKEIPGDAPPEVAGFLEAHLLMLSDPMLCDGPPQIIRKQRANAGHALHIHASRLAGTFDAMQDDYLRGKKNDIRQVVERVQGELQKGAGGGGLQHTDRGSIVVADDLSPADTVLLKSKPVAAFATNLGGPISHTAILARGLGIPAIVGLRGAARYIQNGDLLVVDGKRGLLIVAPDEKTVEEYRARRARIAERRKSLAALRGAESVTADGAAVSLLANIELPDEIAAAREAAAAGVGLYRTEFLFMNRAAPPSEEEQFQAYTAVVRDIARPVTIRTLDLGADKQVDGGRVLFGEGGATVTNPALGRRAVRLCLSEPALFKPQLRAILRASAHGTVEMMIPMMSGTGELEQILALVGEARAELQREGAAFDPAMRIGGMIEVPAAAVTADLFARKLDFLSIGTNDLIQYTLAIDRVDDEVNYLYDPLHPSVLRLIRTTITAGRDAGIPVTMCGEMAGDPDYTRLLLGLGLRAFSMEPSAIPEIKRIIRRTSIKTLAKAVEQIMAEPEPEKIREQVAALAAPGEEPGLH